MEKIIQLMKDTNARISLDGKWLVFTMGEFVVFGHEYNARHNTVHYRGESFEGALEVLKED